MPTVAIVGRANVGKSSIFNRLMNRRQAIVAKEAGTTRDAVAGQVETPSGAFNLIDTAGLKTADDEFEQSIQQQILDNAQISDLLLVVADASAGLTAEDKLAARLARKSGKPAMLIINKAEAVKDDAQVADFHRLGLETVVRVSALHNQGVNDLLAAILEHIQPVKVEQNQNHLNLALIGRPNAGKSSLFNALSTKGQALVSASAGTTRDVNRARVELDGTEIVLMDTAGIRRPGKIGRGIEQFSVARALTAIAESDVCVLVIDATEPGVALEQKLAGIIKDSGKGLIMAVTKWDLVEKDAFTHDHLAARLRQDFQHVPWALLTVTSAQSRQNLDRLLQMALDVQERHLKKLKTSELNSWLADAVRRQPPAGYRRVQPKLKYATQTAVGPPEITIMGRGVRVVHWSYKRYLERQLRESFDFSGTPVRFNFKESDKITKSRKT